MKWGDVRAGDLIHWEWDDNTLLELIVDIRQFNEWGFYDNQFPWKRGKGREERLQLLYLVLSSPANPMIGSVYRETELPEIDIQDDTATFVVIYRQGRKIFDSREVRS